jgi:hypothetical protein
MNYEHDNCLKRSRNTTNTFSKFPLFGLRFESEPSWIGGRNIAQSTNSANSSTYAHRSSVNRHLSVRPGSLLSSFRKQAVAVQLVKTFPYKYGNRMSVIVITTAFYWYLSCSTWIRFTNPFPYNHFNNVVPSTLTLPSGFLHAFLLICIPISWLPMRGKFSVRLILLHFITLILCGKEHKFLKLQITKFSSNLLFLPPS